LSYIITTKNPQEYIGKDAYLFHHQSFVRLRHSNLNIFTVYQLERAVAQIFFEKKDKQASSLPYAPFGGFEMCSANADCIDKLVKTIINHFRQTDIDNITITLPPDSYDFTASQTFANGLTTNGFDIIKEEKTQQIEVSDRQFEELIEPDKRRYLNKCQDFEFRQLPIEKLEEVYHLIKQGRTAKGYSLSISMENVLQLASAFSNRVLLFGLFDKEQLAAAAITIKVSNDILYDFHHEEALDYRGSSPTVALIKGIYEYCQQHQFKLLDLAASMIDDQLNKGLFDFKKSLGANASSRKTYELKIKR